MNKCIKITLKGEPTAEFIYNVIQKHARKLSLEGLAQPLQGNGIKIIVCGEKEQVDNFVDLIHKESDESSINDIEVEPFLKDKDYRGVFRVIE